MGMLIYGHVDMWLPVMSRRDIKLNADYLILFSYDPHLLNRIAVICFFLIQRNYIIILFISWWQPTLTGILKPKTPLKDSVTFPNNAMAIPFFQHNGRGRRHVRWGCAVCITSIQTERYRMSSQIPHCRVDKGPLEAGSQPLWWSDLMAFTPVAFPVTDLCLHCVKFSTQFKQSLISTRTTAVLSRVNHCLDYQFAWMLHRHK